MNLQALQALQAKLSEAERVLTEARTERDFLRSVVDSMKTIRGELRVLMQGVGATPERRQWLGQQVRVMLDELEKQSE